MTTIYVGADSNYLHDKWCLYPGVGDACEVIRLIANVASVIFVCNSLGGIFDGDVYEITLKSTDSEVFFLLRTEFTRIPAARVQQYFARRDAERANRLCQRSMT